MIRIVLSNGETRTWYKDEYTEYMIKGKFFMVKNDDQYVGMYSVDHIVSVDVTLEEKC